MSYAIQNSWKVAKRTVGDAFSLAVETTQTLNDALYNVIVKRTIEKANAHPHTFRVQIGPDKYLRLQSAPSAEETRVLKRYERNWSVTVHEGNCLHVNTSSKTEGKCTGRLSKELDSANIIRGLIPHLNARQLGYVVFGVGLGSTSDVPRNTL